MVKTLLNGGNSGGLTIDTDKTASLIAIQTDEQEYWLYDLSLHVQTSTADFIGMSTSNDSRIAEPTTFVIDFRGI